MSADPGLLPDDHGPAFSPTAAEMALLEAGDPITVEFVARIRLLPEDMAQAENHLGQCIQDVIGGTGAQLTGVVRDV